MKTTIEAQKETCRKWLKDNVATYILNWPGVTVINFQNPGTWNYGMRFIIHARWLVVVGDCGEATYEWGEEIRMDFLKGLDFGYFKSKCRASEVGAKFDEWCIDTAEAFRLDRIDEIECLAPDDKSESDDKEKELLESFCRGDKEQFRSIAQDYYDETGDAEGAGNIADMGVIPSIRCVSHFVGLKMAIEQLQSRGS